MKQDLLKIINNYGIDNQLKYIQSEYFELTEAIINHEWLESERGLTSTYFIAEELADVMVMLKQFQYYYGIEDSEIEKIMLEKIQRQLKRIESEVN